MSNVADKNFPSYCCIVHEFYKAASKNPNKIAVIHAHGGAKIASEFSRICRNAAGSDSSGFDDRLFDEFLAEKTISIHPPVYEGDECFTFSDVMAAVDSLSSRIRNILDGGDDPGLIRPTSVKPAPPNVHFSAEHQNMYTPKILGIYMVPSVEYIVAVLSVLRCGEAFMPLDPSWPKNRILSIVYSSKADYIIGDLATIDGRSSHYHVEVHWLVNCSSCPLLSISPQNNLQYGCGSSTSRWPCDKERRQFCYLMYTSGSTGKPKGVCGTEPGLLNRLLWMQELYPLHGEELLLFKTAISFIDHLQEFLGALIRSCTLVVPPLDELRSNLSSIVDYLQVYSITRLIAVPSLMRVILPTLRSPHNVKVQNSLKLLVLSGEILHMPLWRKLTELLPRTAILNIYGSTEVSGDCTYFDCKRLPLILESEELSSVPIGIPMSGCEVVLVGEDASNEGELYVSGVCVARGYLGEPSTPLDYAKSHLESSFCYSRTGQGVQYYFKTGDFARRLESGDLVFLGRKDRLIKVNGQRISLDEMESTLREHQDVVDAAVVSREDQGECPMLDAHLVTKDDDELVQVLSSSIRSWMVDKVPLAMIPNNFLCTQSLPLSSTGKVDYKLLANSRPCITSVCNEIKEFQSSDTLQFIKKAFSDALLVEFVAEDDDFFALGGDSISAAHASHSIGIDMRFLYSFPTPLKLQMALSEQDVFSKNELKLQMALSEQDVFSKNDRKMVSHTEPPIVVSERNMLPVDANALHVGRGGPPGNARGISNNKSDDNLPIKGLQTDSFINSDVLSLRNLIPWTSGWSLHVECSFGRGNRSMHGECEGNNLLKSTLSQVIPEKEKGSMQELWKVHLESCVDASPLVVFRGKEIYLYIGSHSYKFLCINAKSGSVHWEVKLQGRIECSAAIIDDFSQVVVGCYKGSIYFFDSLDGHVFWTFQTNGEVKSQPLVDKCRHLVWCGSYDHNIYALDYRGHCCIYKLYCGGSIYGSPAIDEVHDKLYVAATSGLLTAISVKHLPFSKLWLQDLGAPVFGSLSINCNSGNVICGLVNGFVIALDANGSITWRVETGGPIFSGPCISHVLPSQVVVCSRDGCIYSFNLETGDLLWEHNIKDPIISSAYADEHLQLFSDPSYLSGRLVCVCGSSGSIHVLRIMFEAYGEANQLQKVVVQEFAKFDLHGDIFSSPVMIGGRIFVGCRDDYVHCVGVNGLNFS